MLKRISLFFVLVVAVLALGACNGGGQSSTPITTLKVGMAYDTAGRGDGSFNDAAYAGLVKARQELGVEIQEVVITQNETDSDRRFQYPILVCLP